MLNRKTGSGVIDGPTADLREVQSGTLLESRLQAESELSQTAWRRDSNHGAGPERPG